MAKSNYMDDYEIVRRLEVESKVVYQYLYERLFPIFRKWLLKNGGTYEEAEDIFQEWLAYFVLYIRRNNGFREDVPFWAFVIRSLKNRWLNELKRKKFELDSIDENLPIASSAPDPMQNLVSNELTEKIRKAIAKLNVREQIIIQLFMEGFKDEEIAQQLDSTAASIKTERHRAFRELKDLLK